MSSSNAHGHCLMATTNISKRVGRVVCIRHASINIQPGELIVVTGTNGSGKTSLCDLLSGFSVPDTGSITVGGKRLEGAGPARFSRLGILRTFQTPRTFDQMTIWDILILAARLSVPHAVIDAFVRRRTKIKYTIQTELKVMDILKGIGWSDRKKREARALSYGERKLLAALTLHMTSGTVAICDEPTAGLDTGSAATVYELLFSWVKEDEKRAIVIMTHDLDCADLKADRMLQMERGVLREI